MIGALVALVRKDLLVFRHDRRALILSFLVPAVLSLFMGFAFRSGGGGAHIRSRVVVEDTDPAAERLAESLVGQPMLGAERAGRAEAEAAVRDRKVDVAFVIPSGFVEKARRGERPELTILHDPAARLEVTMAQGMAERQVAIALSQRADLERCDSVMAPAAMRAVPIAAGETSYDGAAHALAGMGVQFILIAAVNAAALLLVDRQRGLLKRLQAAPISRATVIGARLISGALQALLVIVFLYAFGSLAMKVSIRGSLLGFGLVSITFALMASSLGLLVATLGKTPEATRSVGVLVVLVAVMLGGAWFPSFMFPEWLRQATLLDPVRWAVEGLDATTWRGLGVGAALAPAGVLLASAAVLTVIAALRFRWEE